MPVSRRKWILLDNVRLWMIIKETSPSKRIQWRMTPTALPASSLRADSRTDDAPWATRDEPSLAAAMTTEEFCGRTAHRSAEGLLTPH